MKNPMRERIQARLDALGISAIDAAKRVPTLNRYFIYDFMIGKKLSIPGKRIEEVAKALECEPEFLLGTVGAGSPDASGLALSGVIEPGTWRMKQPDMGADLGVQPDARFSPESQLAFITRSDAISDIGIPNGSVVIVTQSAAPRVGDIVVTKEDRPGVEGAEHMISAEKIGSNQDLQQLKDSTKRILGVAIQSIRVF